MTPMADMTSVFDQRQGQRTSHDLSLLAAFLATKDFFSGAETSALQQICGCLSVQRAVDGEIVLQVGELTDRILILIDGSCTAMMHSRQEGFKLRPRPVSIGDAFAEASLVVSGRRSAEFVAAGRGGAVLAVLTRSAWGDLCARAPASPVHGQARLALMCCCVRSLMKIAPEERTVEHLDDITALLKQLPSLSSYSDPVLRSISESAGLRSFPPGTLLYEEAARASVQFVVLSGWTQLRRRGKHAAQLATAEGARARQPAGEAAVIVGSDESINMQPMEAGATNNGGNASVRCKLDEEVEGAACGAMLEAPALTRPDARAPSDPEAAMTETAEAKQRRLQAERSKHWMNEYVDRARKAVAPTHGDDGEQVSRTTADGASVVARKAPASRAAANWQRAVRVVADAGAEAIEVDPQDATLLNYERWKEEGAGRIADVGSLLGRGARLAYLRGKTASSGTIYVQEGAELDELDGASLHGANPAPRGASWAPGESDGGAAMAKAASSSPFVRLACLDEGHNVVHKTVRLPNPDVLPNEGSPMSSACDQELRDADAEANAVDAGFQHLERLYGGEDGLIQTGQMVGELAVATLAKSISGGQQPAVTKQPKRAWSANAGENGCDVLVVSADCLRRGSSAAREGLLAGRLAVLRPLEPLRGLREDEAAALALGAQEVCYDANHPIVRQGQSSDALYVILEGEVRLVEDTDSAELSVGAGPRNDALRSQGVGGRGGSGGSAVGAQGASGGHHGIKARRAVAGLPVLLLLGPGGTFGESVLGYPSKHAEEAQWDDGQSGDEHEDDDTVASPSWGRPIIGAVHTATAVPSRPCRVLVLSRSLLQRCPSLRSALPAFALLRRQAVAARRGQHTDRQGRLAATSALPDSVAGGVSGPGPSLPTAPQASGAAVAQPRPPPPRPMEILEQMGFKNLSNPRTAALFGSGNNSSGSSTGNTPERRSRGHRDPSVSVAPATSLNAAAPSLPFPVNLPPTGSSNGTIPTPTASGAPGSRLSRQPPSIDKPRWASGLGQPPFQRSSTSLPQVLIDIPELPGDGLAGQPGSTSPESRRLGLGMFRSDASTQAMAQRSAQEQEVLRAAGLEPLGTGAHQGFRPLPPPRVLRTCQSATRGVMPPARLNLAGLSPLGGAGEPSPSSGHGQGGAGAAGGAAVFQRLESMERRSGAQVDKAGIAVHALHALQPQPAPPPLAQPQSSRAGVPLPFLVSANPHPGTVGAASNSMPSPLARLTATTSFRKAGQGAGAGSSSHNIPPMRASYGGGFLGPGSSAAAAMYTAELSGRANPRCSDDGVGSYSEPALEGQTGQSRSSAANGMIQRMGVGPSVVPGLASVELQKATGSSPFVFPAAQLAALKHGGPKMRASWDGVQRQPQLQRGSSMGGRTSGQGAAAALPAVPHTSQRGDPVGGV